MIRDFAATAEPLPRDCDVAIVGAGVAGTILACELARAGKRVVLLESGDRRQDADTHPANRVEQGASIYQGAEHGRFRCLGGTSTRWGGALIPFHREDIEPAWPVGFDALRQYLPRAERIFQLPGSGYEAHDAERALSIGTAADFRVRAAKWPAFRRRNVARLYARELDAARGPAVWLNATLTAMTLADDGRVREIEVRAPGRVARLRAENVVVAAGAIESTRLLLQLDARHDHRLANGYDHWGRYFHDHLSAPVARIAAPRAAALRELTGFRFEGAGMRNARFELNRARASAMPGAFVHVVAQGHAPGGFDALREIYRAVQRRNLPRAADIASLARNGGWLARAAWTRFACGRVLAPDDADYQLHLVTEQMPAHDNRILLSERECDVFGVPLARIEWRVRQIDLDNMAAVLVAFERFWTGRPREVFGPLEVLPRELWASELMRGGGIYHPGGTLRMGDSAATAVVDRDLRVFGAPNLRVLSTATFPNGGSANPTLMLVLFALRMADALSRRDGS